MFAIDASSGSHISFDGRKFLPKPRVSVTITVWMKVNTIHAHQSVFSTVGGSNSERNRCHLEIQSDGRVRWSHKNEHGVIFHIVTKPLIKSGNWTHLALTYDGGLGMARVG